MDIFDLSHHHDEKWRTLDYTQELLNLDYEVKTKLLRQKGRFLVLEIILKRSLTRSLIENIIPPGLLVAVSWVSKYNLMTIYSRTFKLVRIFSDKLLCSKGGSPWEIGFAANSFSLFDQHV